MQPVLILSTGRTLPAIESRRGNFEDWFAAGLDCPVSVHDAQASVADNALNYAAVVVTGSGSMVSKRETWSENTAQWLAQAVADGVPVLGICYGHQLLAHALGGEVGPNPHAREIGSKPLQLEKCAANDPLLNGLVSPVLVQTSHEEAVLTAPTGSQLLATTAQDPHHVLRFSEKAWGLQFHPEFDADIMRSYIEIRRHVLLAEGLNVDELLAQVQQTPQAWGLLQQFSRLLR
ncbi:MAG: glutamine amidotransferase [Xanthomonadales bacterium]|nr:glutamine amidotransferase [Xanthomonadales bacterium]